MSKVDYTWSSAVPPKPDVYTTRRNQSKYLTLRYWDGERWHEIAWTGSRGGTPFTWPAKSRTKRPSWAVIYKDSVVLRKISAHIGAIQWGEPFKVFDKKEVLSYLIATNVLPADWVTFYQPAMRTAGIKGKKP